MEREQVLQELIEVLVNYATDWLKRQNLKLDLDRRQSTLDVGSHDSRKRQVVLRRNCRTAPCRGKTRAPLRKGLSFQIILRMRVIARHPEPAILRYPQTGLSRYRTTPFRSVIQKCAENIRAGLYPILLVPTEQENKARILA